MSEGYALVIDIEHDTLPVRRFQHSWLDARGKLLPLHVATSCNLPKLTKALIIEGADVNLKDRHDWTPLLKVSRRPDTQLELVQSFLDNGAEVNARNTMGWTALMGAADLGNVQMVRVLLDYGADIGLRCRTSRHTALTLAATAGFWGVVEHVLDSGVCTSSSDTVEVLQIATYSRNHQILHMILARGVDVDGELHDPAGFLYHIRFKTALLMALDSGTKGVADLLLAYGADVNARSKVEGTVGLEHALNHGKDYMLEYLLEHGADSKLVKRENLNENGTRRYEEMLSRIKSEDEPSRVQEVEMEEAQADG